MLFWRFAPIIIQSNKKNRKFHLSKNNTKSKVHLYKDETEKVTNHRGRILANRKRARVKAPFLLRRHRSSLQQTNDLRSKKKKKQRDLSFKHFIMVLRSKYLCSFLLIIAILSHVSQSLHFELKSGKSKCISEDIKSHAMTVGKYTVVNPNEPYPTPQSHKINIRVLVNSFPFFRNL